MPRNGAACLIFPSSGPGHLIQIDESVLTKRKYNVGRGIPQKWVCGVLAKALGENQLSPSNIEKLIIEVQVEKDDSKKPDSS
ncbi:hypothetical protein HUJ04_011207, partial [Dendroctonus ponderosae]